MTEKNSSLTFKYPIHEDGRPTRIYVKGTGFGNDLNDLIIAVQGKVNGQPYGSFEVDKVGCRDTLLVIDIRYQADAEPQTLEELDITVTNDRTGGASEGTLSSNIGDFYWVAE